MDCTYKTNVYCMPLCIISSVTPINTTFYVGFCLFLSETAKDYSWVLEMLKKLYKMLDIWDFTVVITDAELGLICAIFKIFITRRHLLCI